jgi:hypothetical protein
VKRSSKALVSVLFVTSVFWIAVVAMHKRTAHDMARNELKAAIPAYAAKVEKTVTGLQGETPSESVSHLYYVTDYLNPGAGGDIVTENNRDQLALAGVIFFL